LANSTKPHQKRAQTHKQTRPLPCKQFIAMTVATRCTKISLKVAQCHHSSTVSVGNRDYQESERHI